MNMRHFINTVSKQPAAPLLETVSAPAGGFSFWRMLESQKKVQESKKTAKPRRK